MSFLQRGIELSLEILVYTLDKNLLMGVPVFYMLSFKEKDGKKEVIIFDIKGRLLKRVFMPIKEQNVQELYPYTIKNGKLYQLAENLYKEEWELHITEIE